MRQLRGKCNLLMKNWKQLISKWGFIFHKLVYHILNNAIVYLRNHPYSLRHVFNAIFSSDLHSLNDNDSSYNGVLIINYILSQTQIKVRGWFRSLSVSVAVVRKLKSQRNQSVFLALPFHLVSNVAKNQSFFWNATHKEDWKHPSWSVNKNSKKVG